MYGRRPYFLLLGGESMRTNTSKKFALAAILAAFSLIALWAATVLKTGTLALLGFSTCFSAVVFGDCGKKYGLMHYFAVSLLALLLVPKGAPLLAYILFLGYYPFVRQKVKPLFARAIIFTAVFVLSFVLFKDLLLPGLVLKGYHYFLGIVGAEIVFFIFDYAIKIFYVFYKEKFSFFKLNKLL